MARKSTNISSGSRRGDAQRAEISYFEGVNAAVDSHVANRYEFSHAENARSEWIGSIEKRRGTIRIGENLSPQANLGLMYFENTNANSNGLYLAARESSDGRLYYYNTDTGQWTSIATGRYSLDTDGSPLQFDHAIAEGYLFVTNRRDGMFYVGQDGTTVSVAATGTAHNNQVYTAPKAGKIAYYKERLYVADYIYTTERVKNGIGFSSYPLGLVALVTEDRAGGEHPTELYVTDTTYILYPGPDILEVYRGGVLKGEFIVAGKAENHISITMPAVGFGGFDIEASDELWIKGTYGDAGKVFRWPSIFGGKSPAEQKTYDTFKLSGGQNSEITMLVTVADVLVYANKDNMGIWNDHYAKSLDLGIGCCSKNGYVKAMGTLWFLDYNGIYASTGGLPVLKSAKVEPYIKGATRAGLESAAAGKKRFSVFFAIGDVTLYNDDGSPRQVLEDVVLEYNLRQENWYVHTGIDARHFASYKDANNAELLAYTDGGDAGLRVYEFLSENKFTDDNPSGEKEIQFRVDTSNLTLGGQFENICYPQEIVAEATRGSAMVTYVSLDNAPFYDLPGNLVKGCVSIVVNERDRKIETTPRCRQLRISIRDYTKKLCKLSRMAVYYTETLETEETRASSGESIDV